MSRVRGRAAQQNRERILKRDNALPSVCGRVCPQEEQCEKECALVRRNGQVAIGRLERFLGDWEAAQAAAELPVPAQPSGKKVAVVGGGPAGLTAAADLVKLGHGVIIFEALHRPGGVLVYGIPEFRLPKAIVDQEVDSCIQVTHRLLRLSLPPPDHQELVDVTEAVSDTLKLLAWEAGERSVQLRQVGDQGPLRVLATDSELRMAVLNLAQNALHAMPKGGILTVEYHRRDPTIEIAVTDTGVGIAPDDLGRIFQPFFSRRADGVEGTGLGLSITKAFVEGHGGRIAVASQAGKGSRFTLEFPDADLDAGRSDAETRHQIVRAEA